MKFSVVAFRKSKSEVEVVPNCWLFSESGGTFTYWPKYRDMNSIKTAAKGGDQPNRTKWGKHSVRILHEFDSYEAAEVNISHFFQYSDFADQNETPAPAQNDPTPPSRSRSTSPESIPKNFRLTLPEFPGVRRQLAHSTPRGRPAERLSRPIGTDQVNLESLCNKLKVMEETFIQNFIEIKEIQRDIQNSVEELKTKISAGSRPSGAPAYNWKSLGLPFTELEAFLEFDSELEPGTDLRKSLVAWLSRSGGKTLAEVVNTILAKVMTNSLAVQFTYFGTAAKTAFAHLNIKEVAYESAVSILDSTDEKQFRVKVQSFLDHAADRIKAKAKSDSEKQLKALEKDNH